MRRILITGGSGMLGSYTAAQAAQSGWETWAAYSRHAVELPGCRMAQLDIRDAAATAELMARIQPDAVVHTAALIKPDVCEGQNEEAFAINVLGTRNVIAAAEAVGAHLIHISTDMVFNGENNPIAPDAPLCPINYYGLTKAAAETAVYATSLDWAIVRTTIIYGPRKFPWLDSFSDKVIDSLRTGKPVSAFVDQVRPPIPAWNLVDVLLEIADRRLKGIYHAVCPEPSARFQFARKIAEVLGLDTDLIEPIFMDKVQSPARRPKMLVLDTVSSSRVLQTRLLGFEEGIRGLRDRADESQTPA